MQKNPLVSVVMITYNQEKYIKQAIESVLEQQVDFDYEIIIGDDNSTDSTSDILKEYTKKHKNIKVINRKKNIGAIPNFMQTFRQARGKYIALCEGDDFWTDPTKLQRQVDLLEDNEDYALVFHPVRVFFENGKKTDSVHPDFKTGFDLNELLRGNFIQTNSVVYRARSAEEYSSLPEDIIPGDWYLHLFHAKFGKIGFIDRVMSAYRRHEGGVWWNSTEDEGKFWQKHGREHFRFYSKVLSETINHKDQLTKEVEQRLEKKEIEINQIRQSKKYKAGELLASLYNAPKKISKYVYERVSSETQKDATQVQVDASSDLAVVVHLFYPEMWPQIKEKLKRINTPFDLYLTGPLVDERGYRVGDFHRATNIIKTHNKGRDVLPFISTMNIIRDSENYKYFLKIHTKKSKHRKDGDEWFEDILKELIPADLNNIFKTLSRPETGLIGPKAQIVSLSRYMGDNKNHMEKLMKGMFGRKSSKHLFDNPEKYPFFGGTMFWGRTSFVDSLLSLEVNESSFEEENGQVDGTIAHAIERVLGRAMHRNQDRNMYTVDSKGAVLEVEDIAFDEEYKYV